MALVLGKKNVKKVEEQLQSQVRVSILARFASILKIQEEITPSQTKIIA